MRRLGKDFDNKAVLSLDEGRLLGRIQDIYLDPQLVAVVGLHMGTEGVFKRKSLIVPRDAIVVLGVDAVLVRDGNVITDDQAVPEAKGWIRRDKLTGRDVDTPGGTKLGVLGDVVVEDDGRISAFSLSRVHVEGPLAESRLIDRRAVIDTGQEDGTMTADLSLLEQGLTPSTLPEKPAGADPFAEPSADAPAPTVMAEPIQVEVEPEETPQTPDDAS